MTDILVALADLHKQATEERSHYYTGSCVREAAREIDHLRGELRTVTDMLAMLLSEERFPQKGRSQDDRDSTQGWWEDRVQAVRSAYAALAGVSHEEWQADHPGLYIPPAGPIKL